MKDGKKKAFFITIEGPEGAGKSSCADVLTRHLEACGRTVICTREPGGTPLAEKLREVVKSKPDQDEIIHPETELLLMEAARAQHVREKISPALASGVSVICDRFTDSTCAYQGGGRKMDMGTIEFLNDFATGGCVPDFTLLLDLPPETGFERVARRRSADAENDRFEAEALAFHRAVRSAFLALAEKYPQRFRVIDASQTLDNVIEQVEKVANELIF